MHRLNDLDGFHLLSGTIGVIAGPIMLCAGAPAGWAFLVFAAGVLVLLAQWAIVSEVTFDQPDITAIVLMLAGAACITIAIVYLTRAANDLPAIFPGYDRDSEHYQLVPGTLALIVGVVVLTRAVASVRPTTQG